LNLHVPLRFAPIILWGYSPYNPALVGKLLDIFRVFYNFVEVGEDKKTPAVRLGLAEKTFLLSEVLA
jgi:hypothetical protein